MLCVCKFFKRIPSYKDQHIAISWLNSAGWDQHIEPATSTVLYLVHVIWQVKRSWYSGPSVRARTWTWNNKSLPRMTHDLYIHGCYWQYWSRSLAGLFWGSLRPTGALLKWAPMGTIYLYIPRHNNGSQSSPDTGIEDRRAGSKGVDSQSRTRQYMLTPYHNLK